MKNTDKKANVGMSTEEQAMAALVKREMETTATELTTAGSRAELEVQNMSALIPMDSQCIAETPKEIQAMVAEGLFAPIHGMAHITNRLGNKLFARVLIDKKGNRTIAFRQQYDDGSYSAEFTIKQDDLIIVVTCADDANLWKDAKATHKRIIREYFRRCDRLQVLNLMEVMTVLLEVLDQLPQVLDYDEEMSKQELYERVLNAVKQSSYIERRKSYSTFVKNYNIIHASLEKAVELGMIPRNPCKGVAFPEDDRETMRVLTRKEQKRFIEQLDGEYYRPMLLMYLYSGLRLGEGVPLTWEDIDLENRTIRVNKKAIVCHDYATHSAPQVVQNKCKTKSSKRKVVITSGLVEVLKAHKRAMMEQAEKLGEEWSESNLVFLNTRGNMVYSRNLQLSLYKIFNKAGIEGATMHTLRHTYATRCFEAGVDIKAISEQLGHKNVKTTYNIYVHLLEDTKVKEIAKLGEIDKLLA